MKAGLQAGALGTAVSAGTYTSVSYNTCSGESVVAVIKASQIASICDMASLYLVPIFYGEL
jgi:hypothetical protein